MIVAHICLFLNLQQGNTDCLGAMSPKTFRLFLLVLRISKYVSIYYVYCYEKIIRLFLFPIRLGMAISINCTFFELLKFTVHIVIVANLHQTELAIMQRTIFFVVRNNKKGKNFGQIAFLLGQYAQKGTV